MRKEVWLFIFFIGTLAFNWPFLEIFGSRLPAYLFTAWLLLIAVIYYAVKKAHKEEDGG